MIWAFLTRDISDDRHQKMTPEERWSYIPVTWRDWWFKSYHTLYPQISLMEPPPLFLDITKEKNRLTKVMHEWKFKSLSRAADKHLTYPEVLCPWGCTEFLHQTNELPFEHFLYVRANGAFGIYSPPAKDWSWPCTIRPDYPKSCCILENPEFVCQACVIVPEDSAPMILCCNDHNMHCKSKYIHPPTNPTGSLHTHNSIQFSPVVFKSRLLRTVKKKPYSDIFSTAYLRGVSVESTAAISQSRATSPRWTHSLCCMTTFLLVAETTCRHTC